MNTNSNARCYDVVTDPAKALRLQGTLLELGYSSIWSFSMDRGELQRRSAAENI